MTGAPALRVLGTAAFLAAALSGGAAQSRDPEPPTPVPPGAGPPAPAPVPGDGSAGPAPAEAADSPEEQRLRAVRAQIEELRARLVEGEARAGSLLDALDEIDLKIAVLDREAVVLQAEMAATRRAETRARRDAETARERTERAEEALRAWLLQLYKTGVGADLRLLVSASTPAHLAGAARAAEVLALADARRVGEFRSERVRLDTALEALQSARERLAALGRDLEARQQDLVTARAGKGTLLQGIRSRQEVEQQALASLVQMERDLQALLGSLPGGPGATPSYGLMRFHGLLDWPVKGPVAIPFGNVRHPKFNTQVPHPGVEIACPSGETVRALFDGRVVFSSWFRGYGQMIVIDHGDEYLSIYGQLGERLVVAGQEVARDAPIARSGGEGTFGVTGLYLEVRHHGRPEDPLPWFRKSAGHDAPRQENRR